MQSTIDLSKMDPGTVRSYIINTILTSPLVLYPGGGGLLLFVFTIVFDTSMFYALGGAFGLMFSTGLSCLNYFGKYDTFRVEYFRRLRKENEEESRKKLDFIGSWLSDHGWDQAATQVEKLIQKMDSFEQVLIKKFTQSELSYMRYHNMAEQVYLNALRNLEGMVTQLEAVETIDLAYIDKRLEHLNGLSSLSESLVDEKASLEERRQMKETTHSSVERILAQNERAMTELNNIALRLAKSHTDGHDSEAILKEALARLNELGDEAEKHWS